MLSIISLGRDTGDVTRGKYRDPSFVAIEADIAKVVLDENCYQHQIVGAAISRQIVTP